MTRKLITLQLERLIIGLGDLLLALLGLTFFIAPALILIAIAISGLFFPMLPGLPLAFSLAASVILAGILNIFCFSRFVFPVLPRILEVAQKANSDAKTRNELERWGLYRDDVNDDGA